MSSDSSKGSDGNMQSQEPENAPPRRVENATVAGAQKLNAPVRSATKKWRAGVLGATGLVGQRLVKLLADHPWFELTEVAASERSFGKCYADAVRWHLDAPIPAGARGLAVKGLDPN